MCEAYSGIGIANINVTHIVSGGANFLVVALGGTIIGNYRYHYYIIVSLVYKEL